MFCLRVPRSQSTHASPPHTNNTLPGIYLTSFLFSLGSAPIRIAHNPDHNLIIPEPFSTISSVLAVLLLQQVPEPFLSAAALPPLPSTLLTGEFDPTLPTALPVLSSPASEEPITARSS